MDDEPVLRHGQAGLSDHRRWAERLVKDADELDPHLKHKADFYIRQLSAALSPSNFVATNPELLRETLAENGENLVRGLNMLAEDIAAGGGELKIRQSDLSKFAVGVNLATTPGKVVYRNETMELLQYTPTTETVYKRPLLLCPPWINKFYVLDLNPEKSFIRWAVEQGLTVFVISWVNPDERQRAKGFFEYMKEGPLTALDEIAKITGEKDVSAIGYCVGGTLLAIALAYMAAKGDKRISSATFFTTQVDFENAGDLKVFVDEEQIKTVERKMAEQGFLAGSKMAAAFNMLRSQDLIWPYVIGNYVRGKQPTAFDLLYWNSDSTRMPEKNHSFYLRNCYLENDLSKGKMEVGGVRLDLDGEDPDLQSRHARGPYRAGALGLRRLGPVRRAGALRPGGLGTHCRRGQPAGEGEVPVLDRRAAEGSLRGLAREGRGASGLLVGRLARLAHRASARAHPGREAQARRPPQGAR